MVTYTADDISRRGFLRAGVVGGAALTLGVPALSACTPASAPAGQGSATPPARPTGVLRAAIIEPDNLDPGFSGGGAPHIAKNVYESLLTFRGDSTELEGQLAESVESSPDAREWTFRLKQGVRFHDGEPLTSSAVKASYQYYAKSAWQPIVPSDPTYDDSDPTVFRVVTKAPSPDIARHAALIRIFSPKLLATGKNAVAKKPTGTGPYRFVSYQPTKSVVLEANENYAGPGPYLERIEYLIIPDAAAQVTALRSGGVDLIFNVAATDAAPLRSDKGLVVTEKAVWSGSQVIFLLTTPPADNVKVRQAFAHAIDKEAIIKAILGGVGEPNDSVMQPGVYGYKAPSTKYPYDVARAKQLIAESGLPTPIDMEVIWAPELGVKIDRMTQAISAMVKEVGINLKVTRKPVGDIGKEIQDPSRKKPYQALEGDLGWLTGGPMFFATKYFQTVSGFDAMNELNDKMLATPDGPERLKLLGDIQELFAQQVPMIPLYTREVIDVHRASVRGYTTSKDGFQPDCGPVFLAH